MELLNMIGQFYSNARGRDYGIFGSLGGKILNVKIKENYVSPLKFPNNKTR